MYKICTIAQSYAIASTQFLEIGDSILSVYQVTLNLYNSFDEIILIKIKTSKQKRIKVFRL